MIYSHSLFNKLKNGLLNTRKKIGDSISKLIQNKKIDITLINNITKKLLEADISVDTTKKIINTLKKSININANCNQKLLRNILFEVMLQIITHVDQPLVIESYKPFIILITGVNGVGKTTTIGKLAYYYQSKYNKKIMLAAGDTRRAGAIDQLKILSQKSTRISVITNNNSDPASIVFEAIHTAKSKFIDILIIDTSGRLQNNAQDMNELKKIIQVTKKIDIHAPHEIMLILDANIGKNSINQVHMFNDAIKITGITMTKLDSSAKGGALFSIADHCPIPIRYIGIGKDINDLQPFKSNDFINAIL